ncbi:DNA/RNA polymerase [Aaosphaeria arxii CBS 175.79]|uniref:DNA/RNA polymerase n=1 Tax=Aaosphaeria arxii CBS 175.79 TaxID=1450172 RepID=A0A6A5XVU5_9PLEO|nr:DNA/RNA polymerase [Aaosphaeria arxii CBS 175.79]KAF2017066.1 DNA/RNA polymerase [Aaosphaeria arxii CBS 175.79]
MEDQHHPHHHFPRRKRLERQLDSVILHFDCFYASVIENETPSLKNLPLAVQQKQIVVTCNYEARRRGLYKLQLIKDAKRICPEVVIVLGEDLTRFRDASKELYAFLKSFSWNGKVDRLGFDEVRFWLVSSVFMDISDIVDYNFSLLNHNDLANSFFCLSKDDPTLGFTFDAALVAGGTYPQAMNKTGKPAICSIRSAPSDCNDFLLRLHLGSHYARHVRQLLETQKGYTCTVGVSTNKLLSKLVGNLHKPNGQTTLLPPYDVSDTNTVVVDNVTSFVDGHEVGKIPGIGFKLAQKLRTHILGRPSELDLSAKENLVLRDERDVLVRDVRTFPGMGADVLERLLGGPGTPHGIGTRVWNLLNGFDDTEVGLAREVPKQISIEDSYIRLDTYDELLKELHMLARSLLNRMHTDLLNDDDDDDDDVDETPNESVLDAAAQDPKSTTKKRWMAFPKTIRLSTRPRPPQNPDGSRNRSFARISRSAAMPNFVFSLRDSTDSLADRLVSETLIPLFRRLHPEKSGWNLSLVNVAATNMVDAASDTAKGGVGRNIAKMFKRQDDVLRQWRVEEEDEIDLGEDAVRIEGEILRDADRFEIPDEVMKDVEAKPFPLVNTEEDVEQGGGGGSALWESEDEDMPDDDTFHCPQCGATLPLFAIEAHNRWHEQH